MTEHIPDESSTRLVNQCAACGTDWPCAERNIANLLTEHEFRFGGDTNCACGTAGIWYWEDWVSHMTQLLAALKGTP